MTKERIKELRKYVNDPFFRVFGLSISTELIDALESAQAEVAAIRVENERIERRISYHGTSLFANTTRERLVEHLTRTSQDWAEDHSYIEAECKRLNLGMRGEEHEDTFSDIQALVGRLVAEIERLKEQVRWRPIESAPKDGTYILICWVSCRPEVGRWAEHEGREGWICDSDECVPANQHDCTHWMPLPLPAPDAKEGK